MIVRPANTGNIGVSLLTQVLYAFVFLTRYLDLFRAWQWSSGHAYNIFFKLFYIFSSIYIIVAMTYIFPRTREREKSWKLATWCVLGALVGAPIALGLYAAASKSSYPNHWFTEVLLLPEQINIPESLTNLLFVIDMLGLLHYPRICLCPAATPATTPDNGADGDRFVLLGRSRLIQSPLYPELAIPWLRTRALLGPDCRYLWRCADITLPRLRLGILHTSASQAPTWRCCGLRGPSKELVRGEDFEFAKD